MKQLPLFVIQNLRRRKLRSWLTIIGIIVGVLAIVSLMSLSQGLKDSITSEFDKLGAQKITINSKLNALGAETNKGLTTNDIREIKKISDIEEVIGKINSGLLIKYNGESKFLTVTGYDITQMEEIFKQDNVELLKGRLPASQKAKEIIIGYDFYVIDNKSNNTPNPMGLESSGFKKKIDVGSEIEINNEKYKVVGILKDTGNSQTNRNCYMPIDTLRKITGASETSVDSIFAIVKDGKDVDIAGTKIEERLERFRGETDFDITTPSKASKDREDMLNIVSIVVVGIASISLLVGGIGIMNSMYTSVLERRKEIGVLKAIGARRKDILSIFLLEAGLIGFIGGVLGTIGGFLLAFGVNFIGTQLGTPLAIAFNLNIVLIALGFSFILGLISGFLPAYNASRQEAVDALHEE